MLYNITYVMLYNKICYITYVMLLCYITCVMLCGPPRSRARNTDAFQVVVYEAQFFSQCVMGRFLFLTHKERGDFMPRVIKWKLHGKVCFTLDKTHQEKGTIVT